MGYRQYLYIIDKIKLNKLRRCKTMEEVYNFYKENNFDASKNEEDGVVSYYCPVYRLGEKFFEFGKYYEDAESIRKNAKPIFKNPEIAQYYEEEDAYFGGEAIVLDAIEWQKKHIISMYESLINNTFENDFEKEAYYPNMTDEEIHYKRLLRHCKDYMCWWKPEFGGYTAIDINKENKNICDSWLYEHTIFDLVRIYKDFNPKKQYILFVGY